jgi:hypothetical protein
MPLRSQITKSQAKKIREAVSGLVNELRMN